MVLLRLKHLITMKLFLIIKKIEERKNFSNVFLKELESKRKNQTNDDKNKVSYLNTEQSEKIK